jgi:hypothetical protein
METERETSSTVLYLLLNTQRVDITISDSPCEVSIRVFTVDIITKKQDEDNEGSTRSPALPRFLQTFSCSTLYSKKSWTSVC